MRNVNRDNIFQKSDLSTQVIADIPVNFGQKKSPFSYLKGLFLLLIA